MSGTKEKVGDNGSTEALSKFADRLENLESQRMAISADIKALGDEITSAGFSHRVLKRIVKARLAASEGKSKPLENLREDIGDSAIYLDVLIPEAPKVSDAA
jgi:uncharacterized protein (UPF0335 family)